MVIKRFLALFIFTIFTLGAAADQGMWLPSLIGRSIIDSMRSAGLQLSSRDLYSATEPALNDAIVRFGSGCSGALISPEGLLITNHHCGYGQIQAHSSVDNDLLTNGFAASTRSQELPNPGLNVRFLRSMSDVTALVAAGQKPADIAARAVKGSRFVAQVEPMYNAGEYYLFVYEVFSDVRLVFAPPSAIGKFGGDTDNWIWPRHTGDFSIFRIYADKNGRGADYSPENVPYHPEKYFTINASGVKEGDFVMVYGFPARTQQFLHSSAVRYIAQRGDPEKVALRAMRLDVMNRAADTSAAVRIKYAAKNAGVSNAWKKWQGEMQGLNRLRTVEKKQNEEKAFETWALGTPYEGLTRELAVIYDSIEESTYALDIYKEAIWASEKLRYLSLTQKERKAQKADFEKDFHEPIDREITAKLFDQAAKKLSAQWLPVGFTAQSEPTVALAAAFKTIEKQIATRYDFFNAKLDSLYTLYIKGLRAQQSERNFYPDANSTLRISYGHVTGYEPCDGVYFKPVSTMRGIIEKDRPEIYDYNVPSRLRELAPLNLDQAVAFIATLHTTGGNSGSPVLDARGRLVGVNFDRVWQGTMSDIEYDATMCRNISLDIRYALFLIDQYAKAGYLLDEMTIEK
ncbi:MAG: S46 family peptidase [Mucinivorans sp.]